MAHARRKRAHATSPPPPSQSGALHNNIIYDRNVQFLLRRRVCALVCVCCCVWPGHAINSPRLISARARAASARAHVSCQMIERRRRAARSPSGSNSRSACARGAPIGHAAAAGPACRASISAVPLLKHAHARSVKPRVRAHALTHTHTHTRLLPLPLMLLQPPRRAIIATSAHTRWTTATTAQVNANTATRDRVSADSKYCVTVPMHIFVCVSGGHFVIARRADLPTERPSGGHSLLSALQERVELGGHFAAQVATQMTVRAVGVHHVAIWKIFGKWEKPITSIMKSTSSPPSPRRNHASANLLVRSW